MEGVAGSLYERTGLASAADMVGFVIRSEINYQADRIRRLPGGDELVHYAGITWSLTRQQAAVNAQAVRDWGQWAGTGLAGWGGEGNGFSYWAGLTLGSYIEGGSNLVAALLVDPLSTAEGLAGAVEAHYQAGGAMAVAGMFTGGLMLYESITGADFLTGEALHGDQRFDRALAGISGITTIVGGSAILRHAAQHGARATLEMIVTAPKNVLIGPKPAFANKLETKSDEAVFWSGIGRGGDKRAAKWVSDNGGATLESTLAARKIKLPPWNPDDPASISAWRQASVDFAAGAKGHIRVLQGESLRANAIFRDEFKALIANSDVRSIVSINPETGTRVLLWPK